MPDPVSPAAPEPTPSTSPVTMGHAAVGLGSAMFTADVATILVDPNIHHAPTAMAVASLVAAALGAGCALFAWYFGYKHPDAPPPPVILQEVQAVPGLTSMLPIS